MEDEIDVLGDFTPSTQGPQTDVGQGDIVPLVFEPNNLYVDDDLLLAKCISLSEQVELTGSIISSPKSKASKVAKQKSSSKQQPQSATHNTRWTEEEDQLLIEGIKALGYGRWSQISKTIQSRSPTQCKNRGRHLVSVGKLEAPPPPVKKASPVAKKVTSDVIEAKSRPVSEDIKSVDANSDRSASEKLTEKETTIEPEEEIDILDVEPEESDNDQSEESKDNSKSSESNIPDNSCVSSISSDSSDDEQKAMAIHQRALSSLENSPVVPSTGTPEAKPFVPVPLPLDEITNDEIESIPDWFPQYSSTANKRTLQAKSVDRYLRIRNGIVEAFWATPDVYLTKRAARLHIKEGDVNAIGKIYDYLLVRGFINQGLEKSAVSREKRKAKTDHSDAGISESQLLKEVRDILTDELVDGKRRTRRVRDPVTGGWMDEKMLEGRTISHVEVDKPKEETQRRRKRIKLNSEDPFELIPCQTADNLQQKGITPPIKVELLPEAIAEMDNHCRSKSTEVIGMLGGIIEKDEDGIRVMKVDMTFACMDAHSTDIQCEMDFMTELKASEYFQEKSRNIVGWYHSHPTFDVSPSVRDVETQKSWQNFFRGNEDPEDNFEPFIGVIISHANERAKQEGKSQIEIFHIVNDVVYRPN